MSKRLTIMKKLFKPIIPGRLCLPVSAGIMQPKAA